MSLDLMIDLETLSTSPRAAVVQLGWCVFDPRGEDENEAIIESNCAHLDVQSQMEHGMVVDFSTIQWWMEQGEEARRLMCHRARMMPSTALDVLRKLWREYSIQHVWSHGACFDVVIVENLYRVARLDPPWRYKDIRDTRTVYDLAGDKFLWPENPIKHSAEADAVAQSVALIRALRVLDPELLIHNQKSQGPSPCTPSQPETSTTPSTSESASSGSTESTGTAATVQSS